VTAEITHSMHQVLDHLVEQVPGVIGALVSSADGFTLAARLPVRVDAETGVEADAIDAAGLGAMSAAALALSNQLAKTNGDSAADVSHHRSADGQVLILPIAHIAVLTVLATVGADAQQLTWVGREASAGIQRLFRGAATV
jgi:predicted regulator of Ras-like GTPase activity (Roadblock/LC7/MglB family)